MGYQPIPLKRIPSRLEVLREAYAHDLIALEDFEQRVDFLLQRGTENEKIGSQYYDTGECWYPAQFQGKP